jgi:hypothetical protein
MDTIFRKTAKGTQELQTRAFKLQPRLRSALVLVDGQRSAAALQQMFGDQCNEFLQALLDGGFIEAAGVARPAAARPAAPAAAAPAPAPAPAAAPARPVAAFETSRREAIRDLIGRLGPMAEALALKMERARNVDELQPLLDTAAQIIGNVRGASAAQDFRQHHRAG